jgi:hypothetical protein
MADSANASRPETKSFYANWGPRDGLILKEHCAPVMGVPGSRSGSEGPIGIARLTGSIPHRKGPAQGSGLEVNKVEIAGFFVCRCRDFIRIGDAREEV